MSLTECREQLELFEVGRQVITVDFEGGDVVADAGLLPIRQLDQQLGILAEAARRLPDPRSPLFIQHSVEALLAQRVYQILAGYPDGNDAQLLKHDPLFKTLVGASPDSEIPLASGSTLNRFLANSQKLLCHVLAYLLWSLFREANSQVLELAKLEVGTARGCSKSARWCNRPLAASGSTWRATGCTLKRPPR